MEEQLKPYFLAEGVLTNDTFLPFPVKGLTFFLVYSILAAVLGMLQFGYNTGVINAPEYVGFDDNYNNDKHYVLL